MGVYLSPGVFVNEIDLSFNISGQSAQIPGFIGVANKGPMNKPTLITNAEQYISTFGEPFPESYLGYAVLAFLEEGNQCLVQRVGVEYDPGLVEELADISIDTSGARIQGWGRIPVFSNIDLGKIELRSLSLENPFSFHDAAVVSNEFSDVDVSPTDGVTMASLGLTGTYTGSIDDTFIILITSGPDVTTASTIDGAEYEIVRNSDGEIIASGVISESGTPGVSDSFDIGTGIDATGLSGVITVTGSSPLEEQDSFTFSVQPDNKSFSFWVDRQEDSSGPVTTTYSFSDGDTYTDADSFVTAFNALIGGGEDYQAVFVNDTLYIVTDTVGQSIQLMGTEAWALEVGQSLYVWDIPRGHLLGRDSGPFNITTANDRVRIDAVSDSETVAVEFSVPNGLGMSVETLAGYVHNGGVQSGVRYWRSYALQVSDDESLLVIEADPTNELLMLQMQATFTHIETLRFAETVEIPFPYTGSYRGFNDPRVALPEGGSGDPAVPASCETDPLSSICDLDSAYYENIVGWFVVESPGTWVDGIRLSLRVFTEALGDSAGRFTLSISDLQGVELSRVDDITFDKTSTRYIGNVINPGSPIGGVNGNEFVHWEERPTYLENDPNLPSFEVRVPSQMNNRSFAGGANGIPTDPIFSSELDRAVIGNPGLSTGIFAYQNPEEFDISLLSTPGFSSGAVIGQAIQMCQARGDVLYIVDPPFGLRPSQVIDWHNGMLLSDLQNAINSSYAALYWGWLEVPNQFQGGTIWVPPSGHVLSIFARTDRVAEQWFAPAGLRRGRLYTPVATEFPITQGERDALYSGGNAVNPIVNFLKEGITIWGQRTLQRFESALDRVNVRMLLIYIKKNLTRGLRPFVFEQNDELTWRQVETVTTGFLADLVARRGLEDFRVIVDERNNTPERRDRNELWVSVFIKPVKSIEFIVLNLVVLRSDQSFSAEEVLLAGGVNVDDL
jgi:phage tail sheath protein FI